MVTEKLPLASVSPVPAFGRMYWAYWLRSGGELAGVEKYELAVDHQGPTSMIAVCPASGTSVGLGSVIVPGEGRRGSSW